MLLHESNPIFGVADFKDPLGIILNTNFQRVCASDVVFLLVPSGRSAPLRHDLLTTSTKRLVATN